MQIVIALAASLLVACNQNSPPSDFAVIRADRQITGHSKFPVAIDPNRVGNYPADTKSGAGYFYDDLLEYRVWLHPEDGAKPLNSTHDYFVAFAEYERASEFSKQEHGAEPPLALVRQREWINEPEKGHFIPEKGDRITEWQVAWLADSKRTDKSIEEFLKHPKEANP